MNKELKVKWVKALRSGDYKQGTGRLNDPVEESYCCLGVLCKVANLRFNVNGYVFDLDLDSDSDSSPFIFGIPSRFGGEAGISDDKSDYLVRLNDVEAATFCEIADYIEINL